jgi:signal transduction histidine kinase
MMNDLAAREQGLKARLAELETLRAVSLELTRTLDLNQVLQTIATSALNLVHASSVEIFTRAENESPLRLAASAGHSPGSTLDALAPEDLVASAAESGKLRAVHATTRAHAHTSVAFPMRLGEQTLGVLRISSHIPRTLSSEDLRILNLLVDQAAVALGNARLYQNLAEREERVRMLMEKMAQVQDEERRLVGLDLHDGLTQLIISANMHLNALNSLLSATSDPRARQELQETRALIQRAIDEARRVIAELRPTEVEDFGLAEGLRRYVLEVAEAQGWESETNIELDGIALSPPAQAAIFRIAQEALSNARKHSDTRAIRVTLQRDADTLRLDVRDWGRGFDPDALPHDSGQIGLIGMKERAAMLEGTCDIISESGHGTLVTVRVPLTALQRSTHEEQHGL